MNDVVKSPKHYQIAPGLEVIDVRRALLDSAETSPYNPTNNAVDCWSRAWEYLTRMWHKNGLEDAEKAKVYLDWLIAEMKKGRKEIKNLRGTAKTLEEAYEQEYKFREDYDPT